MDRVSSMVRVSSLLILVFFTLFTFFVVPTSSLKCYQCGQYTDGPGSITPCINYTERLHLKECPLAITSQCVKYVTEGSTVRDCANAECIERGEGWGTKVYCCSEEGCNAANPTHPETITFVMLMLAIVAVHLAAN